jgi:hypothetical protein
MLTTQHYFHNSCSLVIQLTYDCLLILHIMMQSKNFTHIMYVQYEHLKKNTHEM